MMAISEQVRQILRTMLEGEACPHCNQAMPGTKRSLREVAGLTGTSPSTLSRFLKGSPIGSNILDAIVALQRGLDG